MSTPNDGSRRIASAPDTDQHPDMHPGTSKVPANDPTVIRSSQPSQPTVTAPAREQHLPDSRPAPAAKTSAAAVFALVFGLAALFCALTAILSPAAILFGIIGLILALAGLKMAKRPGITGKSIAVGGLVTALLGLILGGVIIGGLTAIVNNKSQLDRIQSYIDNARTKLPSTDQVRNNIPGQ